MLSMYCFRGLSGLRLPSTYPSTTVLVIWQSWSLQRCPKYESLRLRMCPSNSRFMSSSCRILLNKCQFFFPSSLYASFYTKATFPLALSSVHLAPLESKLLLRKTKPSICLIFSATGMDRSFHRVVSSHILHFTIAMSSFTSLEQSPFDDIREPRFLKCFTFWTGSLLTRMVQQCV